MIRRQRILAVGALALAICALTSAQEKPAVKTPETPQEKPASNQALPGPTATERRFTQLPAAFTSFGAAVQGGYLYVIGGHTAPAHHYYQQGFQTGFWRLSLADRTSWEQLPGGVSLQSVAMVSDGKRVIRLGGMTARNPQDKPDDLHSTAEVEAFDPLTRTWTSLAPLPQPRSSHDAVVHDGKLYVFGGWQLSGTGDADTPWQETGLVLDLAAADAKWLPVDQPFRKRALALASVAGRIYAVGGMTPEGMSASTDIFDPATKQWTKGPDLPGMAFGTSAFGLGGRVFATTFDGVLHSHAPGEAAWKREGTLALPRMFHRLVAAGSGLAAVAGTTTGGHLRTIEWLQSGATGPVVTRLDLPAPGTAKVRQGIFAHRGSLYVFGGNNSTKDHQFQPDNFVDEAFRVNLANLSVTAMAALPAKRQSFITQVVGTGRDEDPQGLAFGGFGFHAGGAAATSQDQILRYDFESDAWKSLDIKLPSPMTQFGHALNGGKVYLFGGMDFDAARGDKKQFQLSDRIWVWDRLGKDDASRKFVALDTKLGTGRRAFAGAELGGKYYLVGGMKDRFEEVETCEAFDFATGKCEEVPAPPDARISARLVPLKGKLYLVGGSVQTSQGLATCRRIDVYDPVARVWSVALADIGFDGGEMQVMAWGQSLLVYSAHNDDGLIRLVFIQP
ncbi:MAG: hypothetical protein IPP14_08360 [Planctomycetes bacterium]|nr:hypothetical protein [Planctomycetota bacterium]